VRKFCQCGYVIWVDLRWNGHAFVNVYHDDGDDCEEKETCFDVITHCPGCGEELREEKLTRHTNGGQEAERENNGYA